MGAPSRLLTPVVCKTRRDTPPRLPHHRGMANVRVVDNRTFLLGLDELYRYAIKLAEADELRRCARDVAVALGVKPAAVPVEGYYTEQPELTEYFLLMRALQREPATQAKELTADAAFARLRAVTGSPLYGKQEPSPYLFPGGIDPMTQAMSEMRPADWSVPGITKAAHEAALRMDDFSLVGLAALSKDAVILAALRETMVLNARMAGARFQEPTYEWQVDKVLNAQARRFVDTFNALFEDKLPPPEASAAAAYWNAAGRNHIAGRCVRIGVNDTVRPTQNYHWAITYGAPLTLHAFWSPDLWTTERYRNAPPTEAH